jgi:hypothetical protein
LQLGGSPASASQRDSPTAASRKRWVAIAVVAVIIVAGASGAVVLLSNQRASPANAGDGPTLYQALEAVNFTVRNLTGGPWILFSYIGFAAQSPFNPIAFGLGGMNLSLRYCSTEYNGLTLWNATSMPVFDGAISSGTAPFWQFEFFSNASQEVLLATDVSDTPHVYAAISQSSPCWEYAGGLVASSYESWVNPLPVDSPIQATEAYAALGASFESGNRPIVETFANGFTPLADATDHGPGGGAQYTLCGQVGVAGWQPKGFVGEWPNGTVQSTSLGNVTCTALLTQGLPAVSRHYSVAFADVGQTQPEPPGFADLSTFIQADFPDFYANGSEYADAWGLLSWMTLLSLHSATGVSLPSSAPSCQRWVPVADECQPTSNGWSAVLTSATGSWLDSFPSAADGSEWAVPTAAIASGEQLMFVFPSAWNVTGDTMNMSGVASIPWVNGTLTL